MAQTTDSSAHQQLLDVITKLFAALRDGDAAQLHSIVTPDFYVFDNGVRMDAATLMSAIDNVKAGGKQFAWTVTEPDVHVEHGVAWIAYVNAGSITCGSVVQDQKWLESGVLEKQSGGWKIAFMHSTRVPAARKDHP